MGLSAATGESRVQKYGALRRRQRRSNGLGVVLCELCYKVVLFESTPRLLPFAESSHLGLRHQFRLAANESPHQGHRVVGGPLYVFHISYKVGVVVGKSPVHPLEGYPRRLR